MRRIKTITAKVILACSLTFSFVTTPPALITASVALVATQSACGPKQKLKGAAEAAKDFGGATNDLIEAVRQAYRKNLITLEQKDKFAALLLKIAEGGEKGVDMIDKLYQKAIADWKAANAKQENESDAAYQARAEKAFEDGIEVPSGDRLKLSSLFNLEIIGPFLTLLTEMGKLSNEASVAIRAALGTLRTIIVLLSERVGRNDAIEQINERWKTIDV